MTAAEELGSREEKLSLADTISQNHAHLTNSYNRLYPNDSYDDFKAEVIGKIDDGWTAEDLDIEFRLDYLLRHGSNYRLIPIILSIAYCIQSQRAFEKGDSEKAWSFIPTAKSFTDMASNDQMREAEVHRAVAQAGGQGRAATFRPAKVEAIRLLHENHGGLGWKKKKVAIDHIVNDLKDFIINNQIDLGRVELSRRLSDWITNDAEIRAVYIANSAETLSNQAEKP